LDRGTGRQVAVMPWARPSLAITGGWKTHARHDLPITILFRKRGRSIPDKSHDE